MPEAARHVVAPLWALVGFGALLTFAAVRLGGRGIAVLRGGLSPLEWAVLIVLTGLFVVGEGVLALRRAYVPRLAARAAALAGEPALLLRLAAPLYAMSLLGASPRALLRAWAGAAAVLAAVLLVGAFPDPWRGIVDFAVAGALAVGVLAVLEAVPGVLRAAAEAA